MTQSFAPIMTAMSQCFSGSALRPPAKRQRLVGRGRQLCCVASADTTHREVVVVGAGAAGLTAAHFAAVSGAKVGAATPPPLWGTADCTLHFLPATAAFLACYEPGADKLPVPCTRCE